MESSLRELVKAFIKDSPGLEAAYRESLEDCDGEEFPNILLADLGKQIGREFERVGRVENKRRFALIEAEVGDEGELRTAVTTGLIEALVGERSGERYGSPYLIASVRSLART